MPSLLRVLAFLTLAASVPGVHAHGGGLDGNGCHHDRKKGGYHCHRGPAAARIAPVPVTTPDPGRTQLDRQYARPQGAFRNCSEARAAGAAPVCRGEPGYGPHLDRDNDGVGCEPYRGR